jgi:hypothetical protein
MKKNKLYSLLWTAIQWFLGIVCLAMICGMTYVLSVLTIDLVESSDIKTEMSNMLISLNANQQGIILAAMVMSILFLVAILIYIVYTIKMCKQSTTMTVCRVRPSVKVAFLAMTAMGMAWSIYLHLQTPHTIHRWQKIVLVALLLPILIVFSSVFLFFFGQPIYYAW